ncbi:TBC domain-containing protein [Exophiala dermatitidis]
MGGSVASSKSPASEFRYSLHGLPYASTAPSKPPIRVTSTTSLYRLPDPDTNEAQGSVASVGDDASTSSNRKYNTNALPHDGDWVQTAGAGSISARDSQTSLDTRAPTISSLTSAAASVPHIRVNDTNSRDWTALDHNLSSSAQEDRRWLPLRKSKSASAVSGKEARRDDKFRGVALDIDIPTGGFSDDLSTTNIEFSKRGSMLIDGRRVNQNVRRNSPCLAPIMDDDKRENGERHVTTSDAAALPATAPSSTMARILRERQPVKVLSADEEMLSEKVRGFYAAGTDEQQATESSTNLAARMGARWQTSLVAEGQSVSIPSLSRATSTTDLNDEINSSTQFSDTRSASQSYTIPEREENELAGGLEDWQDVNSADVDRFGFIVTRQPATTVDGADESRPQGLTRVSTSLQLASETPRRKQTLRRTPSSANGSARSERDRHSGADQTPPRPSSSQSGYIRRLSTGRRSVSSRLPVLGSKNRRLMDSAMDMLTLPRSAQSVVEDGHVHIDDARARRKEIEREEKWRKMARPIPPALDPKTGLPIVGGGSETGYTFDTSSSKLIERTWKGIPDKWRATAWHSFLSTSASRRKDCLSDGELIAIFHDYQTQSSPDDVQIDIDVPRTISSHIMFRRRYRGGQRLLFRVLHAMSLHFSETGYVQGMAALAVTLLAYYDEEKAFVMLVRMWELRGLGELYKAGFQGLMKALDDFETGWLGQGELGRKLDQLGIPPTAYGTRWYLTLFNYTIPFPAQLRVWDVFMLLGDDNTTLSNSATPATSSGTATTNTHSTSHTPPRNDQFPSHTGNNDQPQQPDKQASAHNDDGSPSFGTTLDVLHATSAALIDGMRDILLESDFENAMKVLTSWIPIQDEDLLMRIAKAEWKMHLKHQQHQQNQQSQHKGR